MKTIGITGKIGSGKTLVANLFKLLDAQVIDVDKEAKKLYYREEIREKVEKILEHSILSGHGEVDFRFIAAKYFTSKSVYDSINSVLYPVIKEEIRSLIQKTNQNIVVLDAAMLYEIGLDGLCDNVIFVKAPQELRWKRVKERNPSMKRKDFLLRDRLQHEKNKEQAFIIKNDEKNSVLVQFENFIQTYL